MRVKGSQRKRALQIFEILFSRYGRIRTELYYQYDYQLLIAVILSAQTTDKKVNQVTEGLFTAFPDLLSLANAKLDEVAMYLKELGLYRVKAGYVVNTARKLIDEFGGVVPNRLEDLVRFPGVGRKTANVVLANLFNIPAIPVDTHLKRLSYRMGFTTHRDPVKIEYDLMNLWPRSIWIDFSHCLILFGRQVCLARGPNCSSCEVSFLCPKHMI